jgi:pre-mRNA cleavage complex 2 protein Pcf11
VLSSYQSDQAGVQPAHPPSQNHYQQPNISHPNSYNAPSQSPDVNSLHQDTDYLIEQTKADWARSPYDDSIRVRLKALVDLQSLLKSQQLPPEQLQAVRTQLSMLQVSTRPQSQASNQHIPQQYPDLSTYAASASSHAYQPPPASNAPAFSIPSSQSMVSQPSFSAPQHPPSTDFLAGLLSVAGRNRTPQSQQSSAVPPPASGQNSQAASHAAAENPLIAQLKAAGLLGMSASSSNSHNTTPIPSNAVQPPPNQQPTQGVSTPNLSQLLQKVLPGRGNEIQLTSASLKQ